MENQAINSFMKTNLVKKIAIVGGGSAAWLTAAYLSHNMPNIDITVVDKEISTPIGVGEATILGFKEFMRDCGFEFNEWFDQLDATYKGGIYFPGWVDKDNAVWHPFFMNPTLDNGVDAYSAWAMNTDYDFKTYAAPLYDISINHKKIDSSIIDSYSYHVDCGKLVKYIQKKLTDKITFIASTVISVNRKLDGLNYIILANGQEVKADMFIDCTGFKSMLQPFLQRHTLENRLFCNTALATSVQYQDRDKELTPYTRSEAVDHGWIWTIPTKNRIGTGIVFNSNITSIDEATEYFINYWDSCSSS
jgi:tryptophan halogenase